jgi:tetratricopeptide (TPR) repeat protein
MRTGRATAILPILLCGLLAFWSGCAAHSPKSASGAFSNDPYRTANRPAEPANTPAAPLPVLLPGEQAVRPGVLVLRVWNDGPADTPPRCDIVEPRGLRQVPYLRRERDPAVARGDASATTRGGTERSLAADAPRQAAPTVARDALRFNQDGSPCLEPEYRLVRTYTPDADSTVRYYIYNVDLNNPSVAQNWRELQQAQRAEQRQARAEREADRAWARRKNHLLSASEQAREEGVVLMQAGEYRKALIAFTRAADLNQGDPASRLHVALAQTALGHDAEAAKALRRALELQPRLLPAHLDLPQYYPTADELDAHVAALSQRVAQAPAPAADACFLLGFFEFQRGQYAAAHAAFQQADRARPDDPRTQKYLELTKPARP